MRAPEAGLDAALVGDVPLGGLNHHEHLQRTRRNSLRRRGSFPLGGLHHRMSTYRGTTSRDEGERAQRGGPPHPPQHRAGAPLWGGGHVSGMRLLHSCSCEEARPLSHSRRVPSRASARAADISASHGFGGSLPPGPTGGLREGSEKGPSGGPEVSRPSNKPAASEACMSCSDAVSPVSLKGEGGTGRCGPARTRGRASAVAARFEDGVFTRRNGFRRQTETCLRHLPLASRGGLEMCGDMARYDLPRASRGGEMR